MGKPRSEVFHPVKATSLSPRRPRVPEEEDSAECAGPSAEPGGDHVQPAGLPGVAQVRPQHPTSPSPQPASSLGGPGWERALAAPHGPGGDLHVHMGTWGCVCVSDTCLGPAECPWGPCRVAAVLWMRSGSAQQLQPRAQPGLCRATAPGVGEAGERGAVRPSLGVCCHLVASLRAWFCAGRGENLLDLPGASWPPLTHHWQSQSSPVPPTPSRLCLGCRTPSIKPFITQKLAKTFIILTALPRSLSWREQSARALGFPWGPWQYSPS